MTRSPLDFLRDIVAYAEKAISTVEANPPTAFNRFSDPGMVLMLCLEIIGEAVKSIPNDLKKAHPDLGWKQSAGMRDILSHQYWRTDFETILATVENDLPPFLEGIKQILAEFED